MLGDEALGDVGIWDTLVLEPRGLSVGSALFLLGLEGLGIGHLEADIFSCPYTQPTRDRAQARRRRNKQRCQHGARSLASRAMTKVVPVAVLVLSSPKFILFPICIPFYLLGLLY